MIKIKSRMAGESIRYNPSQESADREDTRSRLKQLLLPKENSAQAVYDEQLELSQLPKPERIAYAVRAAKFPELGAREYDWLKNRVTNPNVDLSIPGLNQATPILVEDGQKAIEKLSKRVNAMNPNHVSVGVASPIIHPERGDLNVLYIRPDLQSGMKFNTLAHESGHAVAGHLDNLRPITRTQKEYEAQTIAYGVQNRFYPWQRQPLQNSAVYVRVMNTASQKGFDEGRFKTYDSPEYLLTPEAQNAINQAVAKIVPNPRKPFKKMIPDFWDSL